MAALRLRLRHGAPLLKVIIHGRRPDGTKIVSQARADGRGGWVNGPGATKGARRVIYRLRDLLGQPGALVCEGEKDVDAAWAIGVPAACNPGVRGNGATRTRSSSPAPD
jgi:hypothetical protein